MSPWLLFFFFCAGDLAVLNSCIVTL